MYIFRLLNGLLDRLFIIASAFLFNQIPAFMLQYMQRLSGHIDELKNLVTELNKIAYANGKTLDQYIQKFLKSSESDILQQGQFIQSIQFRLSDFSQALAHLQESSVLTRPFIFFKDIDYNIAKSTFTSFQSSISLTLEGFYYTLVGILFGYLFYRVLSKSVESIYLCIFKKIKRRKANASS